MLKRLAAALAAAVLVATVLVAHGDPIVGTVTDVKGDNFTLKDRADKLVLIMVQKDTKYLMNKKVVTKAELKVGVRVTVDAQLDPKMKMYHAHEITIGTAPAATPASVPARGTTKGK